MTKLEQAARQALEALEYRAVPAIESSVQEYLDTITALREALDEPKVDWYEEAMRLGALNAKHVGELRKLEAEQAEQEPVAWFVQYKNRHEFVFGSKPEFIVDGVVEPLYAANVRTKDLTDDEICKANKTELPDCQDLVDFARAVIAAYMEKNK